MNIPIIKFPRKESKDEIVSKKNIMTSLLKFSFKNERKLLKALLINQLHQLFIELFRNKLQADSNNLTMECYKMDSKIMQLILLGIVETEKYTLEGIALYTGVPFDVIYDAACGINNPLSITPWSKVVNLYIQVKPNIAQILVNKLIELKEQNHAAFSLLLNET